MANFVSYANAQQLMGAIGNKFASLTGAYIPRGSSTFAQLPATVTSSMLGYVYNVSDDFTTDARFIEGAGKDYPAGSNVVVVEASAATYAVTSDSTAQSEKTYYERQGASEPYTYVVAEVEVGDDVTGLYEKTADAVYKFDVPAGFVDLSGIETEIDNIEASIAEEFDTTESYTRDSFVMYEGQLYQFKEPHDPGAWNASEVEATVIADKLNYVEGLAEGSSAGSTANRDTLKTIIAGYFSSANAYAVGDIVVHDLTGEVKLYKFTSAHTAGTAWNINEVTEITVDEVITQRDTAVKTTVEGTIAPTFAAANAYSVGDVVMYNDGLYKFTSAHTAGDPWDSSEVSATKVADLVTAAEPDQLTAQQIADLEALL